MAKGNEAVKGILKTLPLGALAAASLAACAMVVDDRDAEAERLYGRTWVAEEVEGQPVESGVQPNLVVAPDGKVTGHAGCNGYFGSVIIDGEAMSFGNLGSTKMACAEPVMSEETRLLGVLDSTRGYRVQDERLLLLDGAGATLARFRLDDSA